MVALISSGEKKCTLQNWLRNSETLNVTFHRHTNDGIRQADASRNTSSLESKDDCCLYDSFGRTDGSRWWRGWIGTIGKCMWKFSIKAPNKTNEAVLADVPGYSVEEEQDDSTRFYVIGSAPSRHCSGQERDPDWKYLLGTLFKALWFVTERIFFCYRTYTVWYMDHQRGWICWSSELWPQIHARLRVFKSLLYWVRDIFCMYIYSGGDLTRGCGHVILSLDQLDGWSKFSLLKRRQRSTLQ